MARRLRIQFPGATYHVINRGNYRQNLFEVDDDRHAFERCLFEACRENGWLIHAYVIMRNHFHAAIETPAGNLIRGMHWLETTFSTRFNRFRRERGHVFQGRYQALVVKPGGYLCRLVDYIHLNPVKASIVDVASLATFPWSSYPRFFEGRRYDFLVCDRWLKDLGIEPGSPTAWRRYQEHLGQRTAGTHLAGPDEEEEMSHGWAIGDDEWKISLARSHAIEVTASIARRPAEVSDLVEAAWRRELDQLLLGFKKSDADIANDRKGAAWKIAIAAKLRSGTSASNRWISENLGMGSANAVSVYLSQLRAQTKSYEFGP
jgi:REP element-mobilizing transposase RayT